MLGGMARELDSELLGRLQRQYGEMSDGELLRLAASAGDLTDMAQEVLRGEMQSRKLKLEDAVGDPFAAMERAGLIRDPLPKPEMSTELARGMVALRTFHDAIEAGTACDCLEAEGLEIDVRDVTAPNSGLGSMYGGPPVALQLIVRGADRERAMAILRAKMGLFPLQEVEGTDAQVDDGTVATLGALWPARRCGRGGASAGGCAHLASGGGGPGRQRGERRCVRAGGEGGGSGAGGRGGGAGDEFAGSLRGRQRLNTDLHRLNRSRAAKGWGYSLSSGRRRLVRFARDLCGR